MTFGPMVEVEVETSVVCVDEPPDGSAPAIPMIPQLLTEGRCPGRVFRNLRAVLGRMPTRQELGLDEKDGHIAVELDLGPDEIVLTIPKLRRRLLPKRGGK